MDMTKVTPVGKNFGAYKPGDPFDLPSKVANHLIKIGMLKIADPPKKVRTMKTASPSTTTVVPPPALDTDAQKAETETTDLKADQPPTPAPRMPAAATGGSGRTYQRRDLQARD